jgi:type I restriction enzyme M protein
MNWKKRIETILHKEKNKVATIDLDKMVVSYTDEIRKHENPTTIRGDEEVVRAHLINRLINELDYKPELIEIEKPYSVGRPKSSTGEIDVIVRNSKGDAFYFIEAKAPDKFESDKKYIEGQLFKLAKQENKVKYLVYYTIDYQEGEISDKAIIIDFTKFKNYEEWGKAGYPPFGDTLTAGYHKPKKQPKIKCSDYDLIKEINRDEITSLATNLHNVLWGGGGTGDTEIFYSLVNIILAKIQDESEREDGEKYLFQIHGYGDSIESPQKVYERINELYKRALQQKLFITDTAKINEARIIDRNKFALNKLVYTVQALEKYSFIEGRSSLDGRDILGEFFETITRDGFKQTKGQFFTPVPIVKFVLYALQIDCLSIDLLNNKLELPFIIDPAVGSGTFLIETMKMITKEIKYKQRDKIKTSYQVQQRFDDFFMPDHKENRWAEKFLYGADINFDLGTASKVNMILHGDGSANIFVGTDGDGLRPFRFYMKEKGTSSLQVNEPQEMYGNKEVNEQFDVVASNPPFSVDLDNETKRYLNVSFLFGDKKNSENLFIERWYQVLKPKGRVGVVLPESVFDTTENKYIRLFLFKYFNIKAVVSLPQLTFEHYTSTKTSLLFAQKKTTAEVKEWDKIWEKYRKEWSDLKTRVNNYIHVYIDEEEKSKFPSIKGHGEETIRQNIERFLKDYITKEDKSFNIKELLEKYREEVAELSKHNKDTELICGLCNTWWVFGEVSKEMNYKIFMAEAENVGYKRTKRGEKSMPNDLYDIEIAPSFIDKEAILNTYDEELARFKVILEDLQREQKEKQEAKNNGNDTKTLQKKLDELAENIEKCQVAIKQQKAEKGQVEKILSKYFNTKGKLKEEYCDRTESELLAHFDTGLLRHYRSEDVLLRNKKQIKILDAIRKDVKWA